MPKHIQTPSLVEKVTPSNAGKDPGSPKTNQLQIIQLLEADLNFVGGSIWGSCLPQFCETNTFLDFSQYRSRPERIAITAILNKVITYNFMHLLRQERATIDNDAKACYNHILAATTLIIC